MPRLHHIGYSRKRKNMNGLRNANIRTFDEVIFFWTTTPILVCPDWTMEFHIYCNASNVAIGAVLAQLYMGKWIPQFTL